MSARRTERLLNLIFALMSTRRPLRKDQIRAAVPQYRESETDEGFERMFERDKDELRQLGVPLETATLCTGFEDETGYRIDPAAYALPPVDEAAIVGIEPRVATSEPAFLRLYEASRDARTVTFSYQGADATTAARRTVDPWRLKSWHGHWYLIGYDHDRAAQRVFRLSRIYGTARLGAPAAHPPPQDLDAVAAIAAAFPTRPPVTITVALAPDCGHVLRQNATRLPGSAPEAIAAALPSGAAGEYPGWSLWRLCGAPDLLLPGLLELGPDAVVLDPPVVRAELVQAVRRVREAHLNRLAEPEEPESGRPPGGPADQRTRPAKRPPIAAADRLGRLLAMVPYLLANPGVEMTRAAQHFEITEAQLVKDLQLLFVCGLPGHLPDDLIDAEWESGRIHLSNADTIAQPLRFGLDEAVTLLAGLRVLQDAPGAADSAIVESATATLTAASETAADTARAVEIAVEPAPDPELSALLTDAVRHQQRLRLTYLVTGRDERTAREVAPMRLLAVHGHWYLEAWCHRAQAVRTFRFDRILAARAVRRRRPTSTWTWTSAHAHGGSSTTTRPRCSVTFRGPRGTVNVSGYAPGKPHGCAGWRCGWPVTLWCAHPAPSPVGWPTRPPKPSPATPSSRCGHPHPPGSGQNVQPVQERGSSIETASPMLLFTSTQWEKNPHTSATGLREEETMTTIKASCPVCGDVDLTPAQVRLVVCTVPDWSFYAFNPQARGSRCGAAVEDRRRRRRAVGHPGRGARTSRRAADLLGRRARLRPVAGQRRPGGLGRGQYHRAHPHAYQPRSLISRPARRRGVTTQRRTHRPGAPGPARAGPPTTGRPRHARGRPVAVFTGANPVRSAAPCGPGHRAGLGWRKRRTPVPQVLSGSAPGSVPEAGLAERN